MIPGWPYSIAAALETGRMSWTAPLDAQRLPPGTDLAAVTTAQIRNVTERLIDAGQWCDGDPEMLFVLDAGYDAPRIAYLLKDLPVQIVALGPGAAAGRWSSRSQPERWPTGQTTVASSSSKTRLPGVPDMR